MAALKGEEEVEESTPFFNRLVAEVGDLFDEAPWDDEYVNHWLQPDADFITGPWDLPADYETPELTVLALQSLTLPMMLSLLQRQIAAKFDTMAVPIIDGEVIGSD
jgi:hypothetical protein